MPVGQDMQENQQPQPGPSPIHTSYVTGSQIAKLRLDTMGKN